MLRLIVLSSTHIAMLLCGVGITLLAMRSRRQSLRSRQRALETRELFVDDILSQRRRVHAVPVERAFEGGRHRAKPRRDSPSHQLVVGPRTSLLPNATLAEVTGYLVMERARRITEHRAFEAIMTEARSAWAVTSRRTTRAPQLRARWSA